VQWSEPDQLFVGYSPDFFIGGIWHGSDEQKVYRELSRLVAGNACDTQFLFSRKKSSAITMNARRVMPRPSQRTDHGDLLHRGALREGLVHPD
jgi:hypothetical protein